ncbi:hypothetical protein CDL12_16812 [Handroanthus impetiginosus]|uniref:Probable purine permease n=1 Tax=Handroanthus impetiginosus TaxID=429701 RepID=A0A2G9GZ88_9LAMI|nr:hypothetical protein CDL12_16812 [Handroanthus impetiginosus]
MEVESTTTGTAATAAPAAAMNRKIFLFINCIPLAVRNCGGPLVMRLYFIRGGKRIWLACLLQNCGWPIILIPLILAYRHRPITTRFFMKPHVLLAASVLGVLIGVDNYLYTYGMNKLPVSTVSLIVSTQLIFTSTFCFLIVKQKFTVYSINAVVLLTVGSVLLGIRSNCDRPAGESKEEYLSGFLMTLGAAALYGFIMPLVQLTYMKAKQPLTYSLVLQMQLAMSREANEYELGETKYYLVIVWSAIIWQCFFLGVIGVIFYSSSLLSGIIIAVLLSTAELLAVIFYHEKFQAEKGISLFLSLWGFISYFFGSNTTRRIKTTLMTMNKLQKSS